MKSLLLAVFLCSGIALAQVNVIYDDDCTDDVDCGVNFATLHKLADQGELRILAMIANSGNPLTAPAMKIYNNYYGRPAIPIGTLPAAMKCAHDATCNKSVWLDGLVAHFNPGNKAARYPDCVTLYRSTLASQPDASVVIVETGFLTCLSGLLASPPDTISPLTGAALARSKVSKLVIMGGEYPSGQEYNLDNAPAQTAAVLSAWTAQNGYSPVWFVGFSSGASVQSGPPASANPTINPVRKAFQLAGTTQRGSWDSLAILYAARGLAYKGVTYWTDSGNGVNTVDPISGSNTWSASPRAGQHYLLNALSNEDFSALLDGYQHQGFAALRPHASQSATGR
jgi:hypothetical protein